MYSSLRASSAVSRKLAAEYPGNRLKSTEMLASSACWQSKLCDTSIYGIILGRMPHRWPTQHVDSLERLLLRPLGGMPCFGAGVGKRVSSPASSRKERRIGSMAIQQEPLPSGDTWHIDLFERCCSPPYSPLPALFDEFLHPWATPPTVQGRWPALCRPAATWC